METSLKNLKVDSGTLRVKNSLRLQLLKKKTDIKRRTNKRLLCLKIALWIMNTTIESVENRNRNTEADIMLSPKFIANNKLLEKQILYIIMRV